MCGKVGTTMRDFLQGNMPYIACPQVPVPQPECVPPVTSVCGVWTSDLRSTSVTYLPLYVPFGLVNSKKKQKKTYLPL